MIVHLSLSYQINESCQLQRLLTVALAVAYVVVPIGVVSPPNMHCLVQEMGRVNRIPGAAGGEGDNWYEVHLSLKCLISLYIPIIKHPSAQERVTQLSGMMEVVGVLMAPDKCFHIAVEQYFPPPNAQTVIGPCGNKCTHCSRINCCALTDLLVCFFLLERSTHLPNS